MRGSWQKEQRAIAEVEAFIGAAAAQLMLAGTPSNKKPPPASASRTKGASSSSPLSFTRFLNPKGRRRTSQSAEDKGTGELVTGELTFDAGSPSRAPPLAQHAGDALAVRVSWLCAPALSPAAATEPPSEPLCDGCRKCRKSTPLRALCL